MPIAQTRLRRHADRGSRALKRLRLIEADIAALPDEDLLDLVDIFNDRPSSLIGRTAMGEMEKRGLSL